MTHLCGPRNVSCARPPRLRSTSPVLKPPVIPGGKSSARTVSPESPCVRSRTGGRSVSPTPALPTVLGKARETAVRRMRCPICFDDLHSMPDEVGALVFGTSRVEPTLYHKVCVVKPNGLLRLTTGLSPMTRRRVDGFQLMPPISKPSAWTKFVDWNGDGSLDVHEVAAAIAALLPVDETKAEQFVRKHFDNDGKGVLRLHEVKHELLPYLRKHLGKIVATLPALEAPLVSRSSTEREMSRWFDHWAANGAETLTPQELQLALVASLYYALGDVDLLTKETLAATLLEEVGFRQREKITKTLFLQRMAPLLQSNLPTTLGQNAPNGAFDPKRPLLIDFLAGTGKRRPVEVPPDATVGILRAEACRTFRLFLAGKQPVLFMGGRRLTDDTQTLVSVPGLSEKSLIQVFPGAAKPHLQGAKKRVLTSPSHESDEESDNSSETWSGSDSDSDSIGESGMSEC